MRALREPWNHLDRISLIRVRQRAFRQSTQSPRNLHTTPASPYSPTASGLTHNLNTISIQSPHNLHTISTHNLHTQSPHTPATPQPHSLRSHPNTSAQLDNSHSHTRNPRRPPSPTAVADPCPNPRRRPPSPNPQVAMALLSFPGELWMKALKALVLPLIVCNVALSACELRRRAGGNPSLTVPPSSFVLCVFF